MGDTSQASAKGQEKDPSKTLSPGLYLVATPIGNLRDITLRALDVLREADLILAEDTRHSRRLLDAHGISTPMRSYHEHSSDVDRARILRELADGVAFALISDAGTPLISDPGFHLVRAARARGIDVIPIPGPSAVMAALSMSGLPTDQFLFAGFLPPKQQARMRALEALRDIPATLVFFESPKRLGASLAAMQAVYGNRAAAVARELTKMHETLHHGTLEDLAKWAQDPIKGECVVLVQGRTQDTVWTKAQVDAALIPLISKMRSKQAAKQVAEMSHWSVRDVYQRALALKP